jgi:hypothetical protein
MPEEKKDEKPKRKHLKRIVTEETRDGHYLHHHTYTPSREEDHKEEPERRNVAVSSSPEEAGQHVAEQMGMNQPADASADPAAAGEPEPDASAPAAGAAPAGM